MSARFGGGLHAHASVFIDGEEFAGAFVQYQQPNAGFGGPFTRWLYAYARVYVGNGPIYDEADPRLGQQLSAEWEVRVQAGERLAIVVDGQAEGMSEGLALDYAGVVGRIRMDAFATPQLSARLIVNDSTFDDAVDTEVLLAWERERQPDAGYASVNWSSRPLAQSQTQR